MMMMGLKDPGMDKQVSLDFPDCFLVYTIYQTELNIDEYLTNNNRKFCFQIIYVIKVEFHLNRFYFHL